MNVHVPSTPADPKGLSKVVSQEAVLTGDVTTMQHADRFSKLVAAKGKTIKDAKFGDYRPVVKSDQPGQTIYELSTERAKALGYSGKTPVFTNIPNDVVDAKLGSEVPSSSPAPVVMTAVEKARKESNDAIHLTANVRQEYVDGLTKADPLLNQLQADLQYTQQYVNTDPQAQRDIPVLMARINAAKTTIDNRADRLTRQDTRVQEAQLKFKANQAAALSPQLAVIAADASTISGAPAGILNP